ncbi:MAG: tetratricopeptide repeat protein [Rhodanobacter sp.]
MTDLWQRLRQRKLVQWALAYVAAAFALLQGIDIVATKFGWPETVERVLILAMCVGFFAALLLAWYHGERGAQKVSGMELVILTVLLAIGGAVMWRFSQAPARTAPIATTPIAASTSVVASARADIPQKSIAVLPLANESGDTDQLYFSDGLSEDLINALSQFEGLKVIGRNSAFQFRDTKDSAQVVGAKLRVAHLLEGSVRREADTVRISVELINTSDASTLWSQHYDRPYKDLFKLQDDITEAVASALQAKLLESGVAVVQSDRPPSGNLVAYTAYLQGKFYDARNTEADTHQAIAQYQAAIQADPRYARVYAALTGTWVGLATQYLSGKEAQLAYAKARAMANTALALQPNLAAAHGARGALLLNADFDWAGAQTEYRRASRLAPDDGESLFHVGNLSATLGDPEHAVRLNQQALAIDPLNARSYYWQAIYLSGLGRPDEATVAIQESIALQPAAVVYHEQLAVIEILRGDARASLAAAQAEPGVIWRDAALALARQIGSDHAAADTALKQLIDHWADAAPYQIAESYALRRDPDQMFQWLYRAWASRDPGIRFLLFDPFILRYQHEPRFAAFCHKVGLPTITNAKAMP